MILRAQAPAKVNRELRVGGRRPDGFHEVLSRVVSIDLADHLEVEGADDLDFTSTGEAVASGESNLVVRAARALAARLGIAPRARIRLEKRIPVGSGLGGGSVDAAVTLRLLSRLWNAPGERDDLAKIAGDLGSDVLFFLTGGEADVAGRGERVTGRADGPVAGLLLLLPPFPLSTAAVYAAYERSGKGEERPLPSALDIETSRRFFGPNDLASAVLQTEPRMASYLRAAGDVAREVGISGSGSSIVLHGAAEDAAERLARAQPEARILPCRTLSRAAFQHRTGSSGGSSWK